MSAAQMTYTRFSVAQRIEHLLLILSFTILGLTGLPQKYPLSPISQAVVQGLGGIETIRIIHRVAATVFLLEAVYHLVVVGYGIYVRRREAAMLPNLKDAQDALQVFKHNIGMAKEPPKMDRYNFVEKAEYWAMAWGLIVMAVTGFMLWNPILTTNFLPGEFIPAAKIAHGGEAVLAVLAIILWHFYGVHIKRFNKSMFTGQMEREAMEEEHALELERIEAGKIPPLPPITEQRRRMRIFAPIATIFTLVSLAGVYWFVTYEESAITTIPPIEQAQAFVPATTTPTAVPQPTATPAPTQEGQAQTGGTTAQVGWNGDIDAVFQTRCGACHGAAGGFSAGSYADVMEAVTPGNPDESPAYTVQVNGAHPGLFTDAELARVRQWIESGALEQGTGSAGGPSGPGAASVPVTWNGAVKDMLNRKCGACHGTLGGYSVQTYEDALNAVTPGDPEASRLVEVMQDGHPRTLTPDELARLIDWIQAGAPQE
jgi:cytochrome b subunit of formate dehydrogenase/mono/diheme cytochrome c family protein